MVLLAFVLGLAIGLGGLIWQRMRFQARLRPLLERLRADNWTSHLSSTSQLAIAIQERETQLANLQKVMRAYRQVLEAAPVGYLQVDEENQLMWCNAVARQLLHISLTSLQRQRLLLEVARSYELDQLIEQTRHCQALCQQDWVFNPVSPDPMNLSELPVHPLRGYGLPLPEGQVGVFLESRQEAVTLTLQRNRWTSDVAHELKTPLTSIRLVAETLRSRVDPGLQNWLDRLLNESIRLSNLVEDLLNLSHLEGSNFQGLNPRLVDLPALIDAVWESLEPLATAKHLALAYEGPPQLRLWVDESLMHRMMVNLLDNAIKYSPPRAVIQVTVTVVTQTVGGNTLDLRSNQDKAFNALKEGLEEPTQSAAPIPESVEIGVIDMGTGFVEQDLPHIFERFYRADFSRSRRSSEGAGGTGLGLAIVRQIVEAHQGQISAQNHPDTGGGWLKVKLPGNLVRS